MVGSIERVAFGCGVAALAAVLSAAVALGAAPIPLPGSSLVSYDVPPGSGSWSLPLATLQSLQATGQSVGRALGPKALTHPSKEDLEVDLSAERSAGQDLSLPERLAKSGISDSDETYEINEAERLTCPRESAPLIPDVSAPYWVVPASDLPPETGERPSNNNVSIAYHDGRLFLAWRTAPTHFASKDAHMNIVSSGDYGRTWDFEQRLALGSDLREPFLLAFHGRLFFHFFQAGKNPFAFEPKKLLRIERLGPAHWTAPVAWGEDGEIAWEMKVRKGQVWATTYIGNHYSVGQSSIDVHLKRSEDGVHWRNADESHPVVYRGGVSEAGFEFDAKGDFWSVLRNEDGDSTGFGAQVASAKSDVPAAWTTSAHSDPWRYDSPRMFRHGADLYLVARRDIGGPFDRHWSKLVPFTIRKWLYALLYWQRPKRTALYWVDRDHRKVVWLRDLPGSGDTSFPSLLRTGPHTWLLANYTSPLRYPKRTWMWGQISPQGTQIYLTELSFTCH